MNERPTLDTVARLSQRSPSGWPHPDTRPYKGDGAGKSGKRVRSERKELDFPPGFLQHGWFCQCRSRKTAKQDGGFGHRLGLVVAASGSTAEVSKLEPGISEI